MSGEMENDANEDAGTPPVTANPDFGKPEAPPTTAPEQPGAAQTTAIAPRAPRAITQVGDRGILIQNIAELGEFSRMVYDSGLAPSSMKNAQAVALAVQKGMEHGLTPLAALHAVYVVNGRPAWTGKAALGLVFASGLMVMSTYRAWIEGEGQDMVAYCQSQRVGLGRVETHQFSVKDAITAGLWNKRGQNSQPTPWVTYPKIMLLWKAITHHLNFLYADKLGGMPIGEDIQDVTVSANANEPRRSTLAGTEGSGRDPLLARMLSGSSATVDEPTGDAAPEPVELSEKDRSRIVNRLAQFDEAQDLGELERLLSKLLKDIPVAEAMAQAKFKELAETKFADEYNRNGR